MSLFKNANALYKQQRFEEAYNVIIKEINGKVEFNKYAYTAYSRICRRLNKHEEFLKEIKPLLLRDDLPEFTIEFFAFYLYNK